VRIATSTDFGENASSAPVDFFGLREPWSSSQSAGMRESPNAIVVCEPVATLAAREK